MLDLWKYQAFFYWLFKFKILYGPP